MDLKPTLLMIPCFAGAPWQLDQLHPLHGWPMRTMRLPEHLDDIEKLADFVLAQARDSGSYVLVGDSFGAVIAIAAAVRQPRGLVGLVLSGGFAKSPITSPVLKALAALAPFFPGPFYRQLTLRMHAANLKSRFDGEGEIPWSEEETRAFFALKTPHRAFVNWVNAVGRADYTARLSRIGVPTLILTPEDDRPIGKDAARVLLGGISRSREVVLPRTGHMFRFSHPGRYSEAVHTFLQSNIPLIEGGSSLPAITPRSTAGAAASSQAQVEIAASPERVWDLLSNIDRWPKWNALVQAAVLSGPLHPGSVFRWKSKGLTLISTLHEVTPNQRLTWTGKAFGTWAFHTWEIVETDQGVVLRTAESFDGWLPRLMPKTLQRTLDESLTAWLKTIKSEAERHHAGGGLRQAAS